MESLIVGDLACSCSMSSSTPTDSGDDNISGMEATFWPPKFCRIRPSFQYECVMSLFTSLESISWKVLYFFSLPVHGDGTTRISIQEFQLSPTGFITSNYCSSYIPGGT